MVVEVVVVLAVVVLVEVVVVGEEEILLLAALTEQDRFPRQTNSTHHRPRGSPHNPRNP